VIRLLDGNLTAPLLATRPHTSAPEPSSETVHLDQDRCTNPGEIVRFCQQISDSPQLETRNRGEAPILNRARRVPSAVSRGHVAASRWAISI